MAGTIAAMKPLATHCTWPGPSRHSAAIAGTTIQMAVMLQAGAKATSVMAAGTNARRVPSRRDTLSRSLAEPRLALP